MYRPPRLQPCLTVLPPAAAAAGGPRAAARLGSSSNGSAASTSSPGAAATIRSRLGWSSAGEQQQHHHGAAGSVGAVAGLATGQLLPVSQQGPRVQMNLSYFARLLVNDRVVGVSETVAIKDDFTLDFRDVFR